MVYKKDLICGHSIEINLVSDIEMNISLSQIKLVSLLLDEFWMIFDSFDLSENERPRIIFPYEYNAFMKNEQESTMDVLDSGIETSDFRSTFSNKSKFEESYYLHKIESDSSFYNTPKPKFSVHHIIPLEVLFTGGKISLILFQLESNDKKDVVKFKRKKSKPNFAKVNFIFQFSIFSFVSYRLEMIKVTMLQKREVSMKNN